MEISQINDNAHLSDAYLYFSALFFWLQGDIY